MFTQRALKKDHSEDALSPLLKKEWEWWTEDRVKIKSLYSGCLDVFVGGFAQVKGFRKLKFHKVLTEEEAVNVFFTVGQFLRAVEMVSLLLPLKWSSTDASFLLSVLPQVSLGDVAVIVGFACWKVQ